jgi:putative transcriptional regulator
MIQHHPGEELLLTLAAGRLESGAALLLDAHVETCEPCRLQCQHLQSIGGALIDEAEPALLETDALSRTLARIDAREAARQPGSDVQRTVATPRPALPNGAKWPRSLRGSTISRWHWMGPGMRWSRIQLPHEPEASIFLLRIAPGSSLPIHSHSGIEFTQVLCGSFDDGRAIFGPGDFDAADSSVHHQPIVHNNGECVCLAYVSAPLKFDSKLAALAGRWIGM